MTALVVPGVLVQLFSWLEIEKVLGLLGVEIPERGVLKSNEILESGVTRQPSLPQVYWANALLFSYFSSSSCCQGRGEEIPEGGVLMSTFPFFFTVPTDDETPFVYPLPILVLGPIRLLAFLEATKPPIREIFD